MSVYGTRLLGKCDAVPGFFHVSTRFFHINFVPLIPIQSYVVLSQDGNQFRGVKIPLSGKTVLLAWARFISFVASITLIVACIATNYPNRTASNTDMLMMAAGLVVAIAAFLFVMCHRSCTKASAARAYKLAARLRLSGPRLQGLYNIYGAVPDHGFAVLPAAQRTAVVAALPVEEAPSDESAEEIYPCRVCGEHHPVESCYGEPDGRVICHACWAAANPGGAS